MPDAISVIINFIVDAIGLVLAFAKRFPKIFVATTATTATAVVIFLALQAGIFPQSSSPDTRPTPSLTPPSTPSPKITIGGLDLRAYCKFYGYDGNSSTNEVCSAKIDLDKACRWQYKTTEDLRFKFEDPSNPNSGECFNPQDESLGGISRMSDYCKAELQKGVESIAVDAKTDESVKTFWVCRTTIDKDAACSWQYQGSSDPEARIDDGIWSCYQ